MNSRGALKDAWNRFTTQWQDVEMYQSNIKQYDKQVSRGELKGLLLNNACEIVFVRRRPERAPERPEIRRMLCSNSMNLLNSQNGIRSLNFHLPRGPRKLDEVKHNIVVVWDIMEQDYRNVSMDTCYLRQTVPGDDTFWKYYSDVLLKLSPTQKRAFEDSIA
jgi:hypothetical protein